MSGIKSGRLRHRVVIKQRVDTQDVQGNITESWEFYRTVWAAIEDLSVRDFIAADAAQSQITTQITIRYLPTFDPLRMRIHHGNVVYEPVGVLADKGSGREYQTIPTKRLSN